MHFDKLFILTLTNNELLTQLAQDWLEMFDKISNLEKEIEIMKKNRQEQLEDYPYYKK